ncbi:unnamed protein product, partial [Mesorhabditis spiculigera]
MVINAGGLPPTPSSSDIKEEVPKEKAQYTMHGVLHFLQHEWGQYEMERAKWEMERSELHARISFLQGERKGQDNLKHDLIRRVKMLEYCLKQERLKLYRLTHNGEEPADFDFYKKCPERTVNDDENMSDTIGANVLPFHKGRVLLRQYLNEIGYSEAVVDVRTFRTKSLAEMVEDGSEDDVKAKKERMDSSLDDGRRNDLDMDAADALGEFDFLNGGDTNNGGTGIGDNWHNIHADRIEALKERYKQEKRLRNPAYQEEESPFQNSQDKDDRGNNSGFPKLGEPSSKRGEYMDITDALGIADDSIDIKDNFANDEEENVRETPKWNLCLTLRSHLDSVRAMQFHPVEPTVFTVSEDGTCKMWNLEVKNKEISECEPLYTFRGHEGPIVCMDLSPTGEVVYTAGHDATICCWRPPSKKREIYDRFDSEVLLDRLEGHTDVIWDLAYHSSDNRLVSASADQTIRFWEPASMCDTTLLATWRGWEEGSTPTSVDFVSTEPTQLLAGFSNNIAGILDVETGENVVRFKFDETGPGLNVNKIISHPTMPTAITAGNDRKIRYFDNRTGELIHSAVGHVESISSLAVDPNGLYLLSGSHDGSLRVWDLEKRVCLQEIAAHRKKFDAAVNSIAFHPSRPLIGSAGADSLGKVFSGHPDLTLG